MIKKRICLLLLPLLFNFCSYTLCGQDTSSLSNSFILDYHGADEAAWQAGKTKSGTIHYAPLSLRENNNYLKPAALAIPGTFLIYGGSKPFIKGISNLDDQVMARVQESYPGFHTNAADYIMWVPSASVYLMDALRVKAAHRFREHLIIEAGSIIITGGLGYGMRVISRNIEAYDSKGTKFPSGHTANAFRGAEILHQELKESHPVLSYSGYFAATAVGLLRIYTRSHLLSEVVAGAGLGILSTKLTYWIFNKVKDKRK